MSGNGAILLLMRKTAARDCRGGIGSGGRSKRRCTQGIFLLLDIFVAVAQSRGANHRI